MQKSLNTGYYASKEEEGAGGEAGFNNQKPNRQIYLFRHGHWWLNHKMGYRNAAQVS